MKFPWPTNWIPTVNDYFAAAFPDFFLGECKNKIQKQSVSQ